MMAMVWMQMHFLLLTCALAGIADAVCVCR